MTAEQERIAALSKMIAEDVATRYRKETAIHNDGTGFLFVTVRELGLTDSFKIVVRYKGTPEFYIEVTDKNDLVNHDFYFPTWETAVDAYMVVLTFFTERVKSRFADI